MMKRTLLSLAVVAAGTQSLLAEAAPKVYGKINIAAEQYQQDTAGVAAFDGWQMSSYASRFGVKGEDELTANLSAIYGIEWEVSADGDSRTDLGARNRFLGIKHMSYGAIKLGKLDTNLKTAQGKVDLFNDTRADIAGYGSNAPAVQDKGAIIAGDTRANDVIALESPKFLGDSLSVNVQFILGEGSGVAGATPAATAKNSYNGLTDGISASIVYDHAESGLYLALAHDQEVEGDNVMVSTAATGGANTGRRNTNRLSAGYKVAGLSLGALYQISEGVSDAAIGVVPATAAQEETAWLLSAAYALGDVTLKAQYVAGENDAAVAQERSRYALGADYGFTSKTRAYAYYTAYEEDNGAAVAAVESKTLALGLEHSF